MHFPVVQEEYLPNDFQKIFMISPDVIFLGAVASFVLIFGG